MEYRRAVATKNRRRSQDDRLLPILVCLLMAGGCAPQVSEHEVTIDFHCVPDATSEEATPRRYGSFRMPETNFGNDLEAVEGSLTHMNEGEKFENDLVMHGTKEDGVVSYSLEIAPKADYFSPGQQEAPLLCEWGGDPSGSSSCEPSRRGCSAILMRHASSGPSFNGGF